MADPQVQSEAQARERIEKDARAFLQAAGYDKELGVFNEKWTIYRDLSLVRFQDALPKEDRMALPEMEMAVDVSNIAIQSFGGVWQELLQGAAIYGGKKLYGLVQGKALQAGAPRKLSKQLAEFFTSRFGKEEGEKK